MIRSVKLSDAKTIAEMYNTYILRSSATFEEVPVTELEMKRRIEAIYERLPWLVYEEKGEIMGYAYASDWKQRSGYLHTAETTVYLHKTITQKGIGTKLYSELLKQLEQLNFHAIIAGIALPNEASIALHEKFKFKKIAHFSEVGLKFGRWIDVGYWQLLL